MDLLRNLGSAAVSSLVQKSGLNLPFSLGERVSEYELKSIWTLYDGTKRDDGTPVSVFQFDANHPPRKNVFPLAKNALRKLRTTRHPDVLRFIDAVETDSTVYIVTERVQPLGKALAAASAKSAKEREDWLVWGLHRVSTALAFVNDSCASTHGNLRVHSVFVSTSGEWKLGGFELLSNSKDESAVLYTLGGLIPDANTYASPEVKKGGWSALKEHHPSVADAYALGLLIHSIFNPDLPLPETIHPPHPPPPASARGAIPPKLFNSYKRLLHPKAKARLSPAAFLELGMAQTGEGSGFFAENRLLNICVGLDQFGLSSEADKMALLKSLKDSAGSLPPEFAAHRVLPALVSALSFGGAASTIVPLILQLGVHAAPSEYNSVVLAPVVKLFESQDRGTRMALLEHLGEYVEKLDKATVADKVWPHLQTGFTDTVPVIREATVKSIGLLFPKCNDRILNNDLLRHLARMQMDAESSIRTNTCILIGRMGPSLGYNTKRKVLVPAFARALKDVFVHARVAGLMAFMATIDCFDVEELATKVVPCVSATLIDKEKLVRDQAFKAMELFVKRLETHAASMPETAIEDRSMASVINTPVASSQSALVNSAAGAAGALAGWAMSSLSKKLVPGDLSSAMASISSIDRPTSAPPPLGGLPNGTPSSSLIGTVASTSASQPVSTLNSPSAAPASLSAIQSSRPKGMQLGMRTSESKHIMPGELAAEADGAGAWDNGDLMDVNADEGDWGAFASAPTASGSRSGLTAPRPPSAAVGLDFGDTGFGTPELSVTREDDAWGAIDPSSSPPSGPPRDLWDFGDDSANRAPSPPRRLSSSASAPKRRPPLPQGLPLRSLSPISNSSAHANSRPTTPSPSTVPSTVGMTKEEKAAEMARRKEERKQRIAQLKEQKKQGATKA